MAEGIGGGCPGTIWAGVIAEVERGRKTAPSPRAAEHAQNSLNVLQGDMPATIEQRAGGFVCSMVCTRCGGTSVATATPKGVSQIVRPPSCNFNEDSASVDVAPLSGHFLDYPINYPSAVHIPIAPAEQ